MAKRPDDRHDSAGELGENARRALAGPRTGPGPTTRSRRGMWLGTTAAIAALAAVVVVVALTRGGGHPAASPSSTRTPTVASPPPSSLVEIDAATGRVVRTIPIVDGTRGLAVGEGGVWALLPARANASFLVHLDASTGLRRGRVANVWRFAVGAHGVWVMAFGGTGGQGVLTVERVDAATDEVVGRIPGSAGPAGPTPEGAHLAIGAGGVWVAFESGRVERIGPSSNTVTLRRETGLTLDGLAAGEGAVWAKDDVNGIVARIDPVTGHIRKIPVQGNLNGIAAGLGRVWILDAVSGSVTPIDPATFEVGTPIRVGRSPEDIAVGAGSV